MATEAPEFTATCAPKANSVPETPPLYQFSVEQYHLMIEHGVLTEDDRCELLEGVVVRMSPTGNRHRTIVTVVGEVLNGLLPANWHLLIQQPVTLGRSEPEPDLAIVRGRSRDYLNRSVGPADVGLIVEVADSTLQVDRTLKSRIYAAAGIPQFWIVNLVENTVEAHADPGADASAAGPEFRSRRICSAGDRLPFILDGVTVCEISADDLLP